MKKYNVLVTGCGGDIGQSIGKILKSNSLFGRIVGCDISDDHAGRFIFDQTVVVPPCSSAMYVDGLQKMIEQFDIDLLLPISEPELRMLTDQQIDSHFLNKILISANLRSREVGFDKLATSAFLKASKLPFPETHVIGKMTQGVFPLILKSRKGSGSKSIFILNNEEEFFFYQKKYPDFIAQELITAFPDEYTCGLFRSKAGDIRSIIYKRKLIGGYSGYGEVVTNSSISDLLYTIARELNLIGSINVQLKLSEKGPCVFEINPRFSSTVRFRHMMGFEDLIWSIQDKIGQPLPDFTPPAAGTKFYKGFYEYTN